MLCFSQIEAKLVGLSGTRIIHMRKQIEAIKGLIKAWLFFRSESFILGLNRIIPSLELELGFK